MTAFTDICHPSYIKEDGKTLVALNGFLQGVRKREVKHIPRVYQKDFPDAASFRGNILQKKTPICEEAILYAKYVFMSYVSISGVGRHTTQ